MSVGVKEKGLVIKEGQAEMSETYDLWDDRHVRPQGVEVERVRRDAVVHHCTLRGDAPEQGECQSRFPRTSSTDCQHVSQLISETSASHYRTLTDADPLTTLDPEADVL